MHVPARSSPAPPDHPSPVSHRSRRHGPDQACDRSTCSRRPRPLTPTSFAVPTARTAPTMTCCTTTSTSASTPTTRPSPAKTPSASRCSRTPPHPDRPERCPASRQDSPRQDSTQVPARLRRSLHRLSRDPPRRPDLLHRLLLLRPSPYYRTLRRHGLHQGSRRPSLDLHLLRRRRSQHLVARQRPVARRSRIHGHQRRRPQWPH